MKSFLASNWLFGYRNHEPYDMMGRLLLKQLTSALQAALPLIVVLSLAERLDKSGSLGFAVENMCSLAWLYRITTPCSKVDSSLIGSENGENSFGAF